MSYLVIITVSYNISVFKLTRIRELIESLLSADKQFTLRTETPLYYNFSYQQNSLSMHFNTLKYSSESSKKGTHSIRDTNLHE